MPSFFIPIRRIVGVTAAYPSIERVGPLSRWLRNNIEIRHAGRAGSIEEALETVAMGNGVALCWKNQEIGKPGRVSRKCFQAACGGKWKRRHYGDVGFWLGCL